jgi:heme A synthase
MLDPTPPPVPLLLRLWAWLTVAAALPLALLGAEVTTRGVGMADQASVRAPWYFFTLDLSDTPLGLMIEHGHRLFGWSLGLCAIVLALGLTIAARSWHRWIGWVVLVMVSAQGIFGILRVKYHALAGPELAAFHGSFAQLAFASLVAVAVLSSKAWSRPAATSRSLRVGGLALCVVVYVQIVFGAVTRHLTDPLAQRLHVLLAFVVMGLALWIHGKLHREAGNAAATKVGYFLAVLLLIQPVLGVEAWVRRFGSGRLPELLPPDRTLDLIRSAHHLTGTLIFSTTAALAALLCRPLAAVPREVLLMPASPVSPTAIQNTVTRQLEGSA